MSLDKSCNEVALADLPVPAVSLDRFMDLLGNISGSFFVSLEIVLLSRSTAQAQAL